MRQDIHQISKTATAGNPGGRTSALRFGAPFIRLTPGNSGFAMAFSASASAVERRPPAQSKRA